MNATLELPPAPEGTHWSIEGVMSRGAYPEGTLYLSLEDTPPGTTGRPLERTVVHVPSLPYNTPPERVEELLRDTAWDLLAKYGKRLRRGGLAAHARQFIGHYPKGKA